MATDKPLNPTHVAISSGRSAIEAFHAAALEAGGSDNGAPGLRLDYHPHYFAAFILDPEGNNVEAVCHDDPAAAKAKTAVKAKPKAKAKPTPKPAAKAKMKAAPKAKAKPAKVKKAAPKAKAKPAKKKR